MKMANEERRKKRLLEVSIIYHLPQFELMRNFLCGGAIFEHR